jgi:hypothetical protein
MNSVTTLMTSHTTEGTAAESFLLSDLLLPASTKDWGQYKLFVVLNAFSPSDQLVVAINAKLKRPNKTIVWTYLAGGLPVPGTAPPVLDLQKAGCSFSPWILYC